MIKHVPNFLSASRVPLGFFVLWAAMMDHWVLATILLMVAMTTDALDGFVARRYHVESEIGAGLMESGADMILAVTAITGLVLAGVWSVWTAVGLLVASILMQAAHCTPVKRHSYYVHPMFAVAVIFVVGGTYLWVASHATGLILLYIAALAVVIVVHMDRIQHWLAGPPPAKD